MKQGNSQIQVQTMTQQQVQTLAAQQVLLVRLTEMPLDSLIQRVEVECMENPWLEKKQGEDSYEQNGSSASATDDTAYDYRSEDDIPDYLLRTNNGSAQTAENMEYGDTLSFYDQMKEQMADFDLTPHEQELLEYLIGSLEDDGLLKKSLPAIVDEAEIYQGLQTNVREMERMLDILQQFDPAGIGARSLQECLQIQIRRDEDNPYRQMMLEVMDRCFDDFTHNRWNKIQERLHLSDLQADELHRELMRLNPKPGSAMGEKVSSAMHQITPDFIVETDDYGKITMSLNQGNLPELVVSDDATDRLSSFDRMPEKEITKSIREEMNYTRQYVDRGQMFINALAQRRESMTRVMEAIIRLQRQFFLEGSESMLRPMILEDVAKMTGYDISTVSRVCSGKYVQTTFGTFPLKWFFSQKAIQKDDSETVSSRQVMSVLKELIEGESAADRLGDERLASMLKERGYNIARRTVAKYREQMGIPVARMRK